jgi:hypothetical protein
MMYQPSTIFNTLLPTNKHLPVEKEHEIVEIILSRYLWHYDSLETSRHISKMLERTFRIGSILKIIDK